MPIARVQLPDGRIGRFEVPEGTTPQEIEAFVSKQFSQEKPETNTLTETLKENIGRPLLRTARTGLAGVASIADPINMALGQTPASEVVKNLIDKNTNNFGAPRNTTEQIVDTAGELFTGGGVIGKGVAMAAKGGGKMAQAANKFLGVNTKQDFAGLAGASIAMPVAQLGGQKALDIANVSPESGLRTGVDVATGLAGGILGGVAGAKASNIPVNMKNYMILAKLPEAQKGIRGQLGIGKAKVANQIAEDLQIKGISLKEINKQLSSDAGIGYDPIDVSKTNITNINDLAQIAASRKVLENAFDIREKKIIKAQNNILKGVKSDETAMSSLSKDYIDSLASKMQKTAKPLYDRVFENVEIPEQALTLPEKQKLLQQSKGGNNISDEDMDLIYKQYRNSQKIINANKSKSLIQFIKENGGIYDSGGELTAMGLNNRPGLIRRNPYFNKTTLQGKQTIRVTPDDVALRAWENGYFPEFQERPSANDLLDVITNETKGSPRFSENDLDKASIRKEHQFAIDQVEKSGIDMNKYRQAKGLEGEFTLDSSLIPLSSKYTNSEGQEIFLEDVLTRPDIQAALQKSRAAALNAEKTSGEKFYRRQTPEMADNHPIVLHNLQSFLRRNSGKIDALIPDADEASMMAKRGDILEFLDKGLPGYKDARDTYSEDFQNLLKANKSVKGIIANLQEDKGVEAVNKLFRLSPIAIQKTKNELIAINPNKYNSAVKSFIDQKVSSLREGQTIVDLIKSPQDIAKYQALFPDSNSFKGFYKAIKFIKNTKPVQDALKQALSKEIKSKSLSESIPESTGTIGSIGKVVPKIIGRAIIDPIANRINAKLVSYQDLSPTDFKKVSNTMAKTMADYAFTEKGRELFKTLAKTTKKNDVSNIMSDIYIKSGLLTILSTTNE